MLANNIVLHDRSKHIDTKYHFQWRLYQQKEDYMEYCSIEYKGANILTKGLPKQKLENCRFGLG